MRFTNIVEIKNAAQMLDTAAVQWMNAGPPPQIQAKLNEARESLQRGTELADAPLRIALVGEFNSGKTLLLNALLDSTDIFPCLLQPTTGNVLEVRVHLRREERAPEIRKATISFFNKYEVERVIEFFLKDLKAQNIEGLPDQIPIRDLERFERLLCKKFQDIRAVPPRYAILSALEFIMAVHANEEMVVRDDRHSCPLPIDLIATSLTLTGRPELSKGIQAIYNGFKQNFQKEGRGLVDRITSKNLRTFFPIIRRVMVEVTAWCVPFGVTNPKDCNTLAFLDFPGLGAESSSARDYYLCMTEIADAHAVQVIFNGSNPGTAGASVMASLFQRAGKLTGERTIVAVNRFDEFDPLPTGENISSYYAKQHEGTTVGFSTVLIPAKNLLSGTSKKFTMYICSALCYLFEEKARRPNWNFGNPQWFNDNKRQAAYTLYKRCEPEFRRLLDDIEASRNVKPEIQYMREGLERYLEDGGIPSLRQNLVKLAIERGEKLIMEDSLREVRIASKILDEIAPELQETGEEAKAHVSPEVTYAAQEFYRVLELATADTLPSGPSDYKKLKMRTLDQDLPLWGLIEQEIASSITSWPEWFAILNQGSSKTLIERPGRPQKKFGRYQKIKKTGGTVPAEFNAFNERFRTTAQALTQQTMDLIGRAMLYSLQRFENHPDYRDAIEHFQSLIMVEKMGNMEEALPLRDVWQTSQLAEEVIIPTVIERISDELEAIEKLSYPYDGSKPCFWNLALVIRVQVQLVKTYRDKLSRLVAAAESEFQNFFCNEVLRAEILPLVRTVLNKADFLGEIAAAVTDGGSGGRDWERVGQVVRVAVNKFKSMESLYPATLTPRRQEIKDLPPRPILPVKEKGEEQEPVVEEEPLREESADEAKPGEAPSEKEDEFEEW